MDQIYPGHWSGQPALPERRPLDHEISQSLKRREKNAAHNSVAAKPLSQENTAANLKNSTCRNRILTFLTYKMRGTFKMRAVGTWGEISRTIIGLESRICVALSLSSSVGRVCKAGRGGGACFMVTNDHVVFTVPIG